MAITRYTARRPNPWQDFDQLFNRFFTDRPLAPEGTSVSDWMPAVDVRESAEELTLTADLPGLTEKDIDIEFENGVLTIRGEKRSEEQKDGERYHIWERRYGSFQRSFTLPRTVKSDSVRAEFDQGVLTVHLPKVPEAKSRKIEVSTRA
ncbi:MAG: Hsp20/alpha crystallin family protein [Gemmatimonadota bacterium]|nr:Hsp20/alpha crystallin family protein [Gemmatimonadota bacterium]